MKNQPKFRTSHFITRILAKINKNLIFLSIFDSRVPSNIGHTESVKKLISESKYNYVNEITISNIIAAVMIFLSIIFLLVKTKIKKRNLFIFITIFTFFLIFALDMPLTIFGTKGPVPTESNFLKIIFFL